jgi:putative copper export protein/mono/diheme cytochrome c family protein
MVPPFDIDGGRALVVARGVSVAALLSVLGTLTFTASVAPRAFAKMPAGTASALSRGLLLITRISVGVCALGTLCWLVLATSDIASAGSLREIAAALPTVTFDTAFGRLILAELAALLALALVLARLSGARRTFLALGLAVLLIGLHAGHSHAASMHEGLSFLLVSDVVHLLAAGAWLGGLLPLLLVVRAAPPAAGAMAARRFSPLGKACLYALTATAGFQGWVMIESVPRLFGTAYGWMALVKLALFGVLFGFAWLSRYRLAPALLRANPAHAKRVLVRSIAVQTGFGVAIVAAAATLSSLPPSMHVQPLWPFAERFTLDTIGEDPDFRDEVIKALVALGGAAILLIGAAVIRRRIRWLGVAAAIVIGWFAIPHLDLLFVPAYRTEFYQSPTGFSAESIVQGAGLFPAHCASCHGAEGRGDGPSAAGLPVPPANLTASHLWMHSDGVLFWWLAHGMEMPGGGASMPGFADTLSDDQRWALIDYIRAHNAGLVFRDTGDWSPPVQAPGLEATCADGRVISLADLRGGFVRVLIGAHPPQSSPGVTTLLLTADPAAHPANGLCIADDAVVPRAYAIVAGLDPDTSSGAQFLIDGDGWLRAVQRPGTKEVWGEPGGLTAEIEALKAHPVAPTPGGRMQMDM